MSLTTLTTVLLLHPTANQRYVVVQMRPGCRPLFTGSCKWHIAVINSMYSSLQPRKKRQGVKWQHNMASMTVTRAAHVTEALRTGQNISGLAQATSATPQSALVTVSLTIHACTLCYLVSRAALGYFLANLPRGLQHVTQKLILLHHDQSWILPKILTEQLITWTLIILALVDLAHGDQITHPFVPRILRDTHLTGIIFCMNMGKYIYKSVQDLTLMRHLSNFKVDLLHHSVTLSCYAVFYNYRENLLLGLAGILMESDLLCNEVIRIYKEISCDRSSKCYKRLVVCGGCWTVVSRSVLPVAFLVTALFYQDVMVMQFITIIFWFLAIVFFLAINIWIIFRSGVRMRKAFRERPLPVNARDTEDSPSAEDQYHQSDAAPAIRVACPVESPRVPEKAIALHYKNDLSYLSPYSNINISGSDRNTKLNVSNKKVTAKDTVSIAALFKAAPLRIVDKREQEREDQTVLAGTSSRRSRTFTEMTENCRTSPVRESVIDMRADESRDGVPSVVIFNAESHPRPGHARSNYHRI